MTVYVFLTGVFDAVAKIVSNAPLRNILFSFLGLSFVATVPCLVRYIIQCFK